ncbi:hypothetical protein DSECCO2_551700 [anaerobic digester metagenome]
MILAIKANREVKIKPAERKVYAEQGYRIVEDPGAGSKLEVKTKPAAKPARAKRGQAK